MRRALLMGSLALLGGAGGVGAWDCIQAFQGAWKVEKLTTSPDSLAYVDGTLTTLALNLTAGAYDGALLGSLQGGAPGEKFFVKLESDASNAGTFTLRTESDDPFEEEEEEGEGEAQRTALHFPFAFHPLPSGVVLAQERYHSGGQKEPAGTYQFLVTGANEFVLLLTPTQPTEESVVYVGRRVSTATPPSFLQQFGPTMLIMAIFLGTKAFTTQWRANRPAGAAGRTQ